MINMAKNKAKTTFSIKLDELEVVATSFLDAPREAVFKVITDPSLVPKWWGPKVFTTTVDKMEVRPGGIWRYVQRGPDGNTYAFSGIYREVDPPKRLVYTFNFEPMPGHEHLETLILEEQDGKTKATNRVLFYTIEDRDGMLKTGLETGTVETMNRLAELLGEMEGKILPSRGGSLIITRYFNAPIEEVWKAWIDPEKIKRWWGPKTFTSPVAKIDFRVGGKYLLAMRSPDGKDYWSTGVYKEIVPLNRIVLIDSFADKEGNVVPATYYGMSADFPLGMQVTLTFEERDSRTKFTVRYSDVGTIGNKELVDMRQGWNESLDKLEDSLQMRTFT